MAYSTRRQVLQRAGLFHYEQREDVSSQADGAETTFEVANKNLIDTTNDDTFAVADVTVYVNNSTVTVSSVEADTGKITLASAPSGGDTVEITYGWSNFPTIDIDEFIAEADSTIDDAMKPNVATPLTGDDLTDTIQKISRWMAAGFLLARDYGGHLDSEETSKDGYKAIEKAEEWLADYVNKFKKIKADKNKLDVPTASSEGKLFERKDANGKIQPLTDEQFILDRD